MRISLTNIINQIFFQDNKSDIFTKLEVLNKSLNPSFSGKIENLTESFLVPNFESLENLFTIFKKLTNDQSNWFFSEHFEYLLNLIYLHFFENFDYTPDELLKADQKIISETKEIFLRFKKEFLEFFEKNFEDFQENSNQFLENFRHSEFHNEMSFNLNNGPQDEDNFYSKFLVGIAQIVFCDQIFEKDKADEIKNNFEKILFSNRLYENEKNNGQDYFEISFMENLFFSPYKKLLKLKKIFDSENSSKEKNNSVIVSSILLASQFGIYHTKYSIKLILKLIANYLDLEKLKKIILEKDEHKTLHNWKKILSSYLKALRLGKWSHGLIYVLEKIGVETEDHKDETEKLYQILNLELVKILDIKKHPAADSLNLCMISNGKEVVCGAKNVHFIKDNGFYTVYAPLGSHLPNDMIISPRDIRGVISKGMLCSPDELLANGYSFLKAPLKDLEKDSEICLNRDEKTSGIFVLKESKNNSEEASEFKIPELDIEQEISFVGKFFGMHSYAEVSLTPNIGYLLGEANIAKEIQNFIKKTSQDDDLDSKNFESVENFDLSKIIFKNRNNENSDFESEIILSENASHFFRNIFYFKTSISNIKFDENMLNLISVFSPEFEKEDKIQTLLKYFSGLYGIELHTILKKSLKGRISIKTSLKDHNDIKIHPGNFENSETSIKILKDDLCGFDQEENLVFIPGVSTVSKFCANFSENNIQDEDEIIFIGFLFAKDFEKEFSFYVPQIKLAYREKINNRFTHFYQRQPSLDFENFFINSSLTECIFLMDKEYSENGFKKIDFNLKDLLILFKKDAKLINGIIERHRKNHEFEEILNQMVFSMDDLIEDTKKNNGMLFNIENSVDAEKITSFFDYVFENFIKEEFKSLGFKISDGENSKIKQVFVQAYRTDINSSIDLVAILYKILNFSNKISVTNDNMNSFFDDIEDSYSPSFEFLQNDLSSHREYDENFSNNSFEIQSESQNIPLLSNGENNFMKGLFEALKNLTSVGFCEVIHFSFIDKEKLLDFFDENELIKLKSAINKTLTVLRPNLLVGLLDKYKEIIKETKDSGIMLLEHGPVFRKSNPFSRMITGILGGKKFEKNSHLPVNYFSKNNYFDFFDAKAGLLKALEVCNISEKNLEFIPFDEFYENKDKYKVFHEILKKKNFIISSSENKDPFGKFFHPLKSALVFAKNLIHKSKDDFIFLGYCAELNPFFLEKFDLISEGHEKISSFMIFSESFDVLYENKNHYIEKLFFSEFQSVHRDFSLIFDESVKISEIMKNISEISNSNLKLKNLIHNLKIFDIFQNDDLKEQKKKSVGFSFKIWSKEKTLNDKDVKDITDIILKNIKEELGGIFAFDM